MANQINSESTTRFSSAFEEKMHDRGITPFLGAVASNVKNGSKPKIDDPIWGSVLKRILRLKENSTSTIESNFIENFSSNHKIPISDVMFTSTEIVTDTESSFDEWRVKLVELIILLTNEFSLQVQQNSIVPDNLLSTIDVGDKHSKKIIDLLISIIADLRSKKLQSELLLELLNEKAESIDKSFKILFPKIKIEKKLRLILCKITQGKNIEKIKEFKEYFDCDGTNENYVDCDFNMCCNNKLTLGEIRWLKELLWWSLRFDVPVYPNSSELAHYLSYQINPSVHRDVRDIDLMKVAETLRIDSDLGGNKQLKDLFETIRDNRNPISLNNKETIEISDELILELTEYLFTSNQRYPLLITTNYDTMVETSFEKYTEKHKNEIDTTGYRIIFPMLKWNGDKFFKPTDICWICETHIKHKDGRVNIFYNDIDLEPATNSAADNLKDFSSLMPTIIKLHGNPLLEIEQIISGLKKAYSGSSYDSVMHFTVLTESDYLKSLFLRLDDGNIQKILFSRVRSFWFLGYSVSDWNVRTIIYQKHNYFKTNQTDGKNNNQTDEENNKKNNPQNLLRAGAEEIDIATNNTENRGMALSPIDLDYNLVAPIKDSYNEAFLKKINVKPYNITLNKFLKELKKEKHERYQ